MRKSAAPSFRVPLKKVTENNCQKNNDLADIQENRSTESILNLLKSSTAIINNVGSCNIEQQMQSEQKTDGSDALNNDSNENLEKKRAFNIVYGKLSKKKHKTWEGDGKMLLNHNSLTFKDETGKIFGNTSLTKGKIVEPGSRFVVGGKEVEVIDECFETCDISDIFNQTGKEEIKEPPAKKLRAASILRSNKIVKKLSEIPSGSFILPEPPAEHQMAFNDSNGALPLNAVFVEPCLAKDLRKHQQEGVTFLYECVMGFRAPSITGAILADEMGLGKTLQTIALIWTLMRQGPYGGKAVVKRVLIVTPSSLTANWRAEFNKWIGNFRIRPFVVDSHHLPNQFHINERLMIVSYEMFVRYFDQIKALHFDTIVCDEGHRLKNAACRTSQLLADLCCDRRIILTGTPLQNDLLEFYALVDFANPNCLGGANHFRKYFHEPIVASKDPNCSEEVKKLGDERSHELNEIVGSFVLRRTKELLEDFLPPKQELVVFCRPTELQIHAYNSTIDTLGDFSCLTDGSAHLSVISTLRKLCNHPALLQQSKSSPEIDEIHFEDSGKMIVVMNLLQDLKMSRSNNEKLVLVSNSTRSLDLLQMMCERINCKWLRLDGATVSSQRGDIVAKFNTDPNYMIFLLSSKAGGVGLNLTGASRLVLFDPDWNPAVDLQAMARIWRDGQKSHVFIYRLLTTGTIEEKIFQRQVNKQGLSNGIVDPFSSRSVGMSTEELKDIFARCEYVPECWTHESLNCSCNNQKGNSIDVEENSNLSDGDGENDDDDNKDYNQMIEEQKALPRMNELRHWLHYGPPYDDELLTKWRLNHSQSVISFVFTTQ